jgi:P27 family predicted phage terminase small subunit
MDRKSQTLFRKKVAQMAEVGTMTAHDVEALARYCRLYTRYRAAEEYLMRHGSTLDSYILDKEGNAFLAGVKIRPEAQLANTLAAELLRLENHFGFTPSARTALRVDKKAQHADTDQKTRLFRQKV